MGCDIHTFIEYRNPHTNEWIDCTPEDEGLMGNRNYTLFAILADVRNYDREAKPITLPRDIPSDCSEPIRKEYKLWGVDGHSHSYFTLAELQSALPNYSDQFEHDVLQNFTEALELHTRTVLAPLAMFDDNYMATQANNIRTIFWFDN